MKKVLVLAAFFVVLASSVGLGQVNWELRGAGNTTVPAKGGDEHYLLYNTSLKQGIEYGKRDIGINLEWSGGDDLKAKWYIVIKRKPGSTGPIKTGEKVAIRFDGGGYLKWEDRNVGVNLGWVDSKAAEDKIPYEWEIRTQDNTLDSPLNTNTAFALFNHTNKTFLVYCHRGNFGGVNLSWFNSCTNCSHSADDMLRDNVPYAQTIKGIIDRVKNGTDLKVWGCK